MRDVRKLSASAGAEWLLGGFRLLRQAPLGLGLLGAIYGAVALLVSFSIEKSTTAFMLLELVLVLIGPLLVGGLVFAARSVDRGGKAEPGQLLQGLREHKVSRLLATLLPQVVALLVCALLLVLLIGGDGLAQMAQTLEQLESQASPDPALVAALPLGRMMLWVALVCVIGIVAGFFTFVAVPEIMFTGHGALEAMQLSFRACVRNLPALIVFFVLTLIAAFAVYFAVLMLAFLVRLLAGDVAMQVVLQLVGMAILMPVFTGAMYHAWKQMLADDGVVAVSTVGGFEA